MPSNLFRRYVAPATARPQVWRLILGLVLSLAVYAGWVALILATMVAVSGVDSATAWARALAEGATPTATLVLFISFLGMAAGPMLAARLLHGRGPATLFGPRVRVLRDFIVAALAVAAIYAPGLVIWSLIYDAVPNLDLWLWLAYLPAALLGILIQTGAEELVFRGYMTQQLAARFRSPLIWLAGPAVLFGLVHYNPATAGDNTWLLVGSATVFGLVAADLTRVTGSLGAAWGFHFANNVVAILILATAGTIEGLSLYLTPYPAEAGGMVRALMGGDILLMLLVWALLRRLLPR